MRHIHIIAAQSTNVMRAVLLYAHSVAYVCHMAFHCALHSYTLDICVSSFLLMSKYARQSYICNFAGGVTLIKSMQLAQQ